MNAEIQARSSGWPWLAEYCSVSPRCVVSAACAHEVRSGSRCGKAKPESNAIVSASSSDGKCGAGKWGDNPAARRAKRSVKVVPRARLHRLGAQRLFEFVAHL